MGPPSSSRGCSRELPTGHGHRARRDPRRPSLAELAASASHEGGLGACDDDVEFAFGLDLILDGFERLRATGQDVADKPAL